MGGKSLLGTLSPLYGAMTGEGAFGQALNPAAAERIAAEEKAKQDAVLEQQAAQQKTKAAGMKTGGKVRSASARADGIAIRGKTRA